ncbi:MAG: hypothetical protein ACYS22_16425 [Planctomycetota bacterium]|jgi:hypothetical protein
MTMVNKPKQSDGSNAPGECPRTLDVERAELGGLDVENAAELRAHAITCDACSAAVADLSHTERLLLGAFRWLDGEARPQADAVLARLDEPATIEAHPAPSESARLRPLRRRRRRTAILIGVNLIAATLIVAAYAGYLTFMRLEREGLLNGARIEVRSLAMVIEADASQRGTALPSGDGSVILEALGRPTREGAEPALAALSPSRIRAGMLLDGFGQPFAYAEDKGSAKVYSYGPNRRDDRGEGDDVVALVQLR